MGRRQNVHAQRCNANDGNNSDAELARAGHCEKQNKTKAQTTITSSTTHTHNATQCMVLAAACRLVTATSTRTWRNQQHGLVRVQTHALKVDALDAVAARQVLREHAQVQVPLVHVRVVLQVALVEARRRHLHRDVDAGPGQRHGAQQEAARHLHRRGRLEVQRRLTGRTVVLRQSTHGQR